MLSETKKMIKNIHNSEKEKSFGSAAREVLSQKNGSHATFYYTNGDQYLGEWKSGCREGFYTNLIYR